jgi:hypothetical protein
VEHRSLILAAQETLFPASSLNAALSRAHRRFRRESERPAADRLFPGAGWRITLSGAVVSSPDPSASATFFTRSMGTCSKCVGAFRVAPVVFFIDEQYLSARHAGHLFSDTDSVDDYARFARACARRGVSAS